MTKVDATPADQAKFIAARDAQIQKLKEAESIGQWRKLVLPNAQVGGSELEDIVNIGQAGAIAKALVYGGSDASGRLLSDYEGLKTAQMERTPRTVPQRKYFYVGFVFLFHRAHTS
jgi:pre-mRNA-splicing factor CDC5/CEF1